MVGAGGVDVDVDLEVEGKWRWKDTLDSLVFLADERDLERGEETSSSTPGRGDVAVSVAVLFTFILQMNMVLIAKVPIDLPSLSIVA